ncbi:MULTISPECIES: hypothetical protein [Kitasatospora]|uniref:Uncharacterized protein n=1 Tax=Kitasatospora setae (strain ATCC 33774 / DSM 43861 / JCM 3304 / KCC A-0304 / NBRC 14216 / KM-6054) TaxID=452652 RepID=E4NHZ6_KITSK|nr:MULTISPECIES: hypothetical protein [Kitasatospora]BAJ31126.1 hypothetical protein KSE_53510 [Kitasatospora setae KM-6054]
MRSTRRALLLGATALVGLGLILLLVGGTAMNGGAALGMLAAGWWGMGLIPVHATTAPPEPRGGSADKQADGPAGESPDGGPPDPSGAGGPPSDG